MVKSAVPSPLVSMSNSGEAVDTTAPENSRSSSSLASSSSSASKAPLGSATKSPVKQPAPSDTRPSSGSNSISRLTGEPGVMSSGSSRSSSSSSSMSMTRSVRVLAVMAPVAQSAKVLKEMLESVTRTLVKGPAVVGVMLTTPLSSSSSPTSRRGVGLEITVCSLLSAAMSTALSREALIEAIQEPLLWAAAASGTSKPITTTRKPAFLLLIIRVLPFSLRFLLLLTRRWRKPLQIDPAPGRQNEDPPSDASPRMCFDFPSILLLPPSLGNTTKVTFRVQGSPPKVLAREKLALLRWPPRKLPFGRLDAPGAGNVAAGADKQAPAGSRGAGGGGVVLP